MKKIFVSLMLLGLAFASPAMAQSPSGDACWNPTEAAAELTTQGATLVRVLTEEEVETVRANVTKQQPDGEFNFTRIEFWDTPNDNMIWVVIYVNNTEVGHTGEVCFAGSFPQTQEQVDAVLVPVE